MSMAGRDIGIMEVISDIRDAKNGYVLTIGNFDGVHIGHQAILSAAKRAAVDKAAKLIVMTFEPHPLAVLRPQSPPGILTPLALKKHLLAQFGVDYLFVVESGDGLLRLSPADFVNKFLVKDVQPYIVFEGEDFNFGAERVGGVDTLRQLGIKNGFEVCVIDSKEVKFMSGRIAKISSTMIRGMLEDGKVADAAVALGRPYRLIERVVPGRGKGKQIGFPTANMKRPRQIIPAEGVYAGFAEIADSFERLLSAKEKLPAVFSIGRSQTLGNDNPLTLEAHLLVENTGDLLGKWLAMDFVKYIRSQIKFNSEKELAEQIARDCKETKKILGDVTQ